jgi:hypothetical protein
LYTYGGNNPLKNRDLDGHCTVDKEEHGWLWCAAHSIGLTQTVKEQADAARQSLAQAHGFTINGQAPADIAKTGTDQQVIAADRAATNFLLGVAQQSMAPCAPGVLCGIMPIGPLKGPSVTATTLAEQLTLEEAAAAGAAGTAKVAMTELGDAPRLVANYGPGRWVKMEWTHRALDGTKQTLHWFKNERPIR